MSNMVPQPKTPAEWAGMTPYKPRSYWEGFGMLPPLGPPRSKPPRWWRARILWIWARGHRARVQLARNDARRDDTHKEPLGLKLTPHSTDNLQLIQCVGTGVGGIRERLLVCPVIISKVKSTSTCRLKGSNSSLRAWWGAF